MNDSKLTMPVDCEEQVEPQAQRQRLASPRMVNREPMLLTGLRDTMCENFAEEIPLLWQKFIGMLDLVSHKVDRNCYGLCMKETQESPGFYYMACCEVSDFVNLSAALSPVILPSHCYAVFKHEGHVAQLKESVYAIFDDWLPASDYQLAQQSAHCLHHLEKYSEQFNPESGMGGMEIWVPVVLRTAA